jgi:regulator of PEP synthase PpsR (kinase-PPPase family)
LEHPSLPRVLQPYRSRLYGLTIRPERLQQIRQERRPDSRYASLQQVHYEVRAAEAMFHKHSIPYINTTDCSIEEIASRIMQATGIERRVHP